MWTVIPVHHQTQLIPTTTPRKAISIPTRVVKALERKIIHQMLKTMVLGELSIQDLGEGSTTSTITEIRFMFQSNKMRSIFLLVLLLPLGMNAYAEVLTPICINSIQSRQFQDKVVELQRKNATFMSAVEAISVNLHPKLIHHLHLILTHLKVYSKCFYLWITSLFLPPLLV